MLVTALAGAAALAVWHTARAKPRERVCAAMNGKVHGLPVCTPQRVAKAAATARFAFAPACATYEWLVLTCGKPRHGTRHTHAAPTVAPTEGGGASVAWTTGGGGSKGVAARKLRVARASAVAAQGEDWSAVEGAGSALHWQAPEVFRQDPVPATHTVVQYAVAFIRAWFTDDAEADYDAEADDMGVAQHAASIASLRAASAAHWRKRSKTDMLRPFEGLDRHKRRRHLHEAAEAAFVGNPQLYCEANASVVRLTVQVPDSCAFAARRGAPIAAGVVADVSVNDEALARATFVHWPPSSGAGAFILGTPRAVTCPGATDAMASPCIAAPYQRHACVGGATMGVGIVWRRALEDSSDTTWETVATPADADAGAANPTLLELPDTRQILFLYRRGTRWYRAVAPRMGAPFARSSVSTFMGGPAPIGGFAATAGGSAALLAVFEAKTGATRSSVELAVSEDEARSWRHVATVEEVTSGGLSLVEPSIAVLVPTAGGASSSEDQEDAETEQRVQAARVLVAYIARANGAASRWRGGGVRVAHVVLAREPT